MIEFLAGRRVTLSPPDMDPLDGPWILLPSEGRQERIELVARDKGRSVGLVRLEQLDWAARSARLALRWPGSREDAFEIVALMVRYAEAELNLERLEAVATADAASILAETGFARLPAAHDGGRKALDRFERRRP